MQAACLKTGECECFTGYRGDGVASCEISLPIFTGITPKKCSAVDCVINASFSNTEKLAGTGYCRFGDVLVQADQVVSGVISCKVPHIQGGKTLVAISFDSSHFSEVQLPLKIYQPADIDSERVIRLFLLFAVVFGVGMALYRKAQFNGRWVPKNSDHEKLVRGRGVL
jgi:hypothetical protein